MPVVKDRLVLIDICTPMILGQLREDQCKAKQSQGRLKLSQLPMAVRDCCNSKGLTQETPNHAVGKKNRMGTSPSALKWGDLSVFCCLGLRTALCTEQINCNTG